MSTREIETFEVTCKACGLRVFIETKPGEKDLVLHLEPICDWFEKTEASDIIETLTKVPLTSSEESMLSQEG